MPPVWPLEPAPTFADSKRATLLEGSKRRSQAAAERPENPPPTMAKSTSLGMGPFSGEKPMVHGGLPQFVLFVLGAVPDTSNLNPKNQPTCVSSAPWVEPWRHQAEVHTTKYPERLT